MLINNKGSWLDLANYQAVTLIPVLLKIMERLIIAALSARPVIKPFTNKNQHGFFEKPLVLDRHVFFLSS